MNKKILGVITLVLVFASLGVAAIYGENERSYPALWNIVRGNHDKISDLEEQLSLLSAQLSETMAAYEELSAAYDDLIVRVTILEGGCLPDCEGKECGDDGCGGSCGTCNPEETCVSGICVGCPTGQVNCGGQCVDLDTDEEHCGGCWNECNWNQECVNGVCAYLPPDIQLVTPDVVSIGSTVTVYGYYFASVFDVALTGDAGTSYHPQYTLMFDDSIEIVVSQGAAGETFDVTFENMGGSDTYPNAFTIDTAT